MNRKKSREVTMKLLFESMIKGEDYKTILLHLPVTYLLH